MTLAATVPIVAALLGALIGGFITHLLGGRRDIAAKRREIILLNLISALEELEKAGSDRPDSDLKQLEKVIFRIQMVGDSKLVELARKVVTDISQNGRSDNTPLYNALRARVRDELRLRPIPDGYVGLVIRYPGDKGFDDQKEKHLAQHPERPT